MFWYGNCVFKLNTIDVPSGLQTRNFQSSVIHDHEFSLIGKFNVYICEALWKAQQAALRVIWILAGNWLTMVTSISRHDLLSWHRPHTKNIKSFCDYVMAIDVNQFEISFEIININHICFCIFIHAIKLMKGKLSVTHEDWPNLGMTDPVCWPLSLSWESVLLSCTTNNPNFIWFKKINLVEIIFHEKNNNFWYYFIAKSSTY